MQGQCTKNMNVVIIAYVTQEQNDFMTTCMDNAQKKVCSENASGFDR